MGLRGLGFWGLEGVESWCLKGQVDLFEEYGLR